MRYAYPLSRSWETHRLTLQLTVLSASTCKPIKGAAVDIWHADAAGNYSGFGSDTSSRTFLRGIQKTDRNGLAVFRPAGGEEERRWLRRHDRDGGAQVK
jgi:protocatechuate 3,4-dioxygenase beta subunit